MNKKTFNRCPPSGYYPPFKKQDSWLVWICNEEGKIEDFEIYQRLQEDEFQWERVYWRVNDRLKGYFDTGNCESEWDKVSLENLFFKFFYQYSFVSEDIKLKCLKRLGWIDEFSQDVQKYLNYMGIYESIKE